MLYVQMELCERGTLRQIAPSLELDVPRAQPAAWKIVAHIGSALGMPRRPRHPTLYSFAMSTSSGNPPSPRDGTLPSPWGQPTTSLTPRRPSCQRTSTRTR